MNLLSLLSLDRIACETEVSSKKRAFERLSEMLATTQPDLSPDAIFDALINREKLGCTTLGNGVAIPHACLPINEPCGALLVLEEGIKMDAPDRKPVKILLALLVPSGKTEQYTPIMTDLTQLLAQKAMVESIAHCVNKQTLAYCLRNVLTHTVASDDTYTHSPLAA